jgi:allantoicase
MSTDVDPTRAPGSDGTDGTDVTELVDLASRLVGGSVLAANDELFAERENLIKPEDAVFQPHVFGHKGQIYDGWETRRRREPGHDWAIVRLGLPGVVKGVVVDTAWFKGNYPPEVSVEGVAAEGYPTAAALQDYTWWPLVSRSPASGDNRNLYQVSLPHRMTHVRLCQYPDGGVARLRVHGLVVPDPRFLLHGAVDLAALENGGWISGCSNRFYSSPTNLISPGQARVMGEGWETARRRDDGNDWVEISLAGPGVIRMAELDLTHFVGNSPGSARITGCDTRRDDPADPASWAELLPRSGLEADTRHRFRTAREVEVTRARVDVYPDGGMARVRLWGDLARSGRDTLSVRWYNTLPDMHAQRILGAAGMGAPDVEAALARRPIDDADALPPELHAVLAG